MNKILFKLIEGKGKFFLMRDVSFNDWISTEIVNPEVVVKKDSRNLPFTLDGKRIRNNDTFPLPEGMGFEEYNELRLCTCGCGDELPTQIGIRLLPEKPMNCNVPDHIKKATASFETASKECSNRLMVKDLSKEDQERILLKDVLIYICEPPDKRFLRIRADLIKRGKKIFPDLIDKDPD